jgi:ABC-type multidrug transport system permease subunit
MAMSMIFRSIGSLSRSLAQALAPAAVFILALIIYTGFTIPTRDMHPWFRWINYIDPVAYAFEALMINEVCTVCHGSSSVTDLPPVSQSTNSLLNVYSDGACLRQC